MSAACGAYCSHDKSLRSQRNNSKEHDQWTVDGLSGTTLNFRSFMQVKPSICVTDTTASSIDSQMHSNFKLAKNLIYNHEERTNEATFGQQARLFPGPVFA